MVLCVQDVGVTFMMSIVLLVRLQALCAILYLDDTVFDESTALVEARAARNLRIECVAKSGEKIVN